MTNYYLHVVETGEGFVADSARELGGTDEDLCRIGDPILSLKWRGRGIMVRIGSGCGRNKANVEGNRYSTTLVIIRATGSVVPAGTHSGRVVWVLGREFGWGWWFLLARRAKGERDGIFTIDVMISF